MANRRISDLTALTAPASGDYLPIVDISEAAAADKNKRITVEELLRGAPNGTAGAPGIAFESDPNTGIYSPGADQVAISTNGTGRLYIATDGKIGVNVGSPTQAQLVVASSAGANTAFFTDGTNSSIKFLHGGGGAVITTETGQYLGFGTSDAERLRITSDGKVGLGTSAPGTTLDVSAAQAIIRATSSTGTNYVLYSAANGTGSSRMGVESSTGGGLLTGSSAYSTVLGSSSNHPLHLGTNATTALTIDTSQRVGVGTTSPAKTFDCLGDVALSVATNGTRTLAFRNSTIGTDYATIQYADASGLLTIKDSYGITFNGASEWGRWDASGRLLVGTSSGSTLRYGSNIAKIETNSGDYHLAMRNDQNTQYGQFVTFVRSRSNGAVQSGDELGSYQWQAHDGTDVECIAASITAFVDGTPGANDMPGRLVFSTTADGASSPTERMRLNSNGYFYHLGPDFAATFQTAVGAGTTYSLITGGHTATSISSVPNACFRVWSNGDVVNTNNSYGALSDIKLKENIVDANSQWSDIKALQVRKYNFKQETGQQTHTQIGLIAQEVELVSPGLVSESPDRDEDGNDLGTVTKSVNYSVLYMKAVKALQEAMERIETLEAKVAALESA